MCVTCGCGETDQISVTDPITGDQRMISHDEAHAHGHSHSHEEKVAVAAAVGRILNNDRIAIFCATATATKKLSSQFHNKSLRQKRLPSHF